MPTNATNTRETKLLICFAISLVILNFFIINLVYNLHSIIIVLNSNKKFYRCRANVGKV